MSTLATLVLARKYRPRRFAEMVGQEHVVRALTNALTQQRLHHAYLFTGTRGVGKTTVSRILAKSLNCIGPDGSGGITAEPCGVCSTCLEIDADRYIDYTELDAASNRGIDEVKDLIERAAYKPSVGRFKVFMIDEAHQLTKDAFNALLKTLEEPPDYLKFVLATTDPEKMLPTVLSRCLQFNLRPMAPATVREHLGRVLRAEGIAFDDAALRLLARAARGSMRDGLSLTDQAIAFGSGALAEESVRSMLGAVDRGQARALIEALARRDGAAVLRAVDGLRGLALSAGGTLEELTMVLQQMAVEQAVPGALDTTDPDTEDARALHGLLAADETQLLYSMALHGRAELALMSDEYGALTMVLLRFLAFPPVATGAVRAPASDSFSADVAADVPVKASAAGPAAVSAAVSAEVAGEAMMPATSVALGSAPGADPALARPATAATPARAAPLRTPAPAALKLPARPPWESADTADHTGASGPAPAAAKTSATNTTDTTNPTNAKNPVRAVDAMKRAPAAREPDAAPAVYAAQATEAEEATEATEAREATEATHAALAFPAAAASQAVRAAQAAPAPKIKAAAQATQALIAPAPAFEGDDLRRAESNRPAQDSFTPRSAPRAAPEAAATSDARHDLAVAVANADANAQVNTSSDTEADSDTSASAIAIATAGASAMAVTCGEPGDRWAALVRQVCNQGGLQALARELALNAGLLAVDVATQPPTWRLQVEHEMLRNPVLQDRLRVALVQALGSELALDITAGVPADTPARREVAARRQRQAVAEAAVRGDPDVQLLLAQFKSARIVPGSIQPVADAADDSPNPNDEGS